MISAWLRRGLRWAGGSLYSLGFLIDVVYVGTALVGLPLVILKRDVGKGPEDLTGSYGCLISVAVAAVLPFVYIGASLDLGNVLINSMIISCMGGMILTVLTPGAQKFLGENWVFVPPCGTSVRARHTFPLTHTSCACAVLLSLELAQVSLFIGLKLTDIELYTTVFFQISCEVPLNLCALPSQP